ncbi:MAG: STAS/SEC14 domain-containing protein [Nannocystales bacterium]
MFTVTRVSPIRVEIESSGKLDGDEMNAALDSLIRETEGLEHGQMLFRVGEFALPTFAGLKVEFARLPSMLGFVRKFRRCAVLADQRWLKRISELEGALIPGVEIRGFGLEQQATAEAWLEEP